MRNSAKHRFTCHNLKAIDQGYVLELSHLHEHELKIKFPDTLNLLCVYGCGVENTYGFFSTILILLLQETLYTTSILILMVLF